MNNKKVKYSTFKIYTSDCKDEAEVNNVSTYLEKMPNMRSGVAKLIVDGIRRNTNNEYKLLEEAISDLGINTVLKRLEATEGTQATEIGSLSEEVANKVIEKMLTMNLARKYDEDEVIIEEDKRTIKDETEIKRKRDETKQKLGSLLG